MSDSAVEKREFYRGMTAAIAVLSGHGEDTFIGAGSS
ncbi:hypothetical protein LCGC14_0541990 [marine sediment metagenome]|uniref:Uncharacterized protein n=1 Tax=marine sediment metagenome TaxID=412755 RepID=A0A0F9SB49_9ZZZZ